MIRLENDVAVVSPGVTPNIPGRRSRSERLDFEAKRSRPHGPGCSFSIFVVQAVDAVAATKPA
jgi:hypothetical protein